MKFCHKLLIAQVLQYLLLGKAGVKGTPLVPDLGQQLRRLASTRTYF